MGRHHGSARERQLDKILAWLRDNRLIITRDKISLTRAAQMATKRLSFIVTKDSLAEFATAMKFAWPEPPKLSEDEQAKNPGEFDVPTKHALAERLAGPDVSDSPEPVLEATVVKPEPVVDELVKMMTQFAMSKNAILQQSNKVAEADKFVRDAELLHKAELDKLNKLMTEDVRLRRAIKEAMEI